MYRVIFIISSTHYMPGNWIQPASTKAAITWFYTSINGAFFRTAIVVYAPEALVVKSVSRSEAWPVAVPLQLQESAECQ